MQNCIPSFFEMYAFSLTIAWMFVRIEVTRKVFERRLQYEKNIIML